ncbi:GNAT family N-acetyltransferase [Leifsonia poae]|uniref:GNAT family N-acetyltransferase n=1 Tax=Leifsonia poae TaxID=110933 RepID=UPI001CC0212E|nr:GNAT family N-acetyltransferase [Leifsonia poae]
MIRGYGAADLAAVYDICVKTGASGEDATGLYDSDSLLPDIYAGPYLALEPRLARVVEVDGRVLGYCVAAADSAAFAAAYRRAWLPRFAAAHPLVVPPRTPSERLIEIGHRPESLIGPDAELFPAHLHIDLLPDAQGAGWGRSLLRALLADLRALGVPGVQLGVGERNVGARGFYEHLGFAPLPGSPQDHLRLGIANDAPL